MNTFWISKFGKRNTVILGLLCLCLWLVAPAQATEIPFDPAVTIDTINIPYEVISADLDSDADLDALYFSSSKLAWKPNLGDGTFGARQTIASSLDLSQDITIGDSDNDGDLDVFLSYRWHIVWYENLGNGTFGAAQVISTVYQYAQSLAVGDVDQDGDGDLITGVYINASSYQLIWFENLGGIWSSSQVIESASFRYDTVLLTDLNNDGKLDILANILIGVSDTSWFENLGGGVFADSQLINGASNVSGDMGAGDLDNDGDIDIVIPNSNNNLSWYENLGPGNFVEHAVAPEAFTARVADMDGDGDLDIISKYGTAVRWHENIGNGTSFVTRTIDTVNTTSDDLTFGDVDKDGDLDILTSFSTSNEIVWYRNNTIHREARFPIKTVVDNNFDGAWWLDTADINNDGNLNIIGTAALADEIAFWQYNGSTWTRATLGIGLVDTPSSIQAVDIDGDGDQDIVVAERTGSDLLHIWENKNTAWTVHQLDTGALTDARSASVADMDGDGDLDIVAAFYGADAVAWWENTPAFDWTISHTVETMLDGVNQVTTVDMDRDGDMDILGAGRLADTVVWWENFSGNGIDWLPRNIDTAVNNPRMVQSGDMDRDGDMDVIGVAGGDDLVTWWENTSGNGTSWTEHIIDNAFDNVMAFAVADLDADGDLDITGGTISTAETSVVWWENSQGNATVWDKQTIDNAFAGVRKIHTADVDSDGDIDILAASYDGDEIALWHNQGGQFRLATWDTAPATIEVGTSDDLLRIEVTHNGRFGDNDGELVQFRLWFEESAGDNLTTAEANALIENLHIYKDDGDDTFDAGTDTLVLTIDTLSLSGGRQTITFADGDANVQFAQGTAQTYFVVTELTPDAHAQTANSFRMTHMTNGTNVSAAEDRDHDIPLTLSFIDNKRSSVVTAVCNATPPTAPNLSISLNNDDVVLTWTNSASSYELWPYSTVYTHEPMIIVTGTTHTYLGIASDLYWTYYTLRTIDDCGNPATVSNSVAEFPFPIMPGN